MLELLVGSVIKGAQDEILQAEFAVFSVAVEPFKECLLQVGTADAAEEIEQDILVVFRAELLEELFPLSLGIGFLLAAVVLEGCALQRLFDLCKAFGDVALRSV